MAGRDSERRVRPLGAVTLLLFLRTFVISIVFRCRNTRLSKCAPAGVEAAGYRLESVLGAGAFGMTYLGWDTHLEKLVAIKEYLPTELAVRALDGSVVPITTDHGYNYQWGLDRFIQEARTLARFSHPNIARVNRYFEANGTGYMVMDYEKGSLWQLLRDEPPPARRRLRAMIMPLLDGLEAVHAAGFLHRDINLPTCSFARTAFRCCSTSAPHARRQWGDEKSHRDFDAGLRPARAVLSDGHQGPWSDIYALAGYMYRALVNENPPDAVSGLRGMLFGKLAGVRGRASDALLDAAEWALALDEICVPGASRVAPRPARRNADTRSPGGPAGLATAVRPGDVTTVRPRRGRATCRKWKSYRQRRIDACRHRESRIGLTGAGLEWASPCSGAVALVVTWNNQRLHDKTGPGAGDNCGGSGARKAPSCRPNPAASLRPSSRRSQQPFRNDRRGNAGTGRGRKMPTTRCGGKRRRSSVARIPMAMATYPRMKRAVSRSSPRNSSALTLMVTGAFRCTNLDRCAAGRRSSARRKRVIR